MKSVSFSDLRNYSDMSIRTDHFSIPGESIIKRSSSYKNLTYYSSSEDILKRFSSKTSELKSVKNGTKSDNRRIEQLIDNRNNQTPQEDLPNDKYDEKVIDYKTTNTDNTIQELRLIISNHEKTISKLQEENLILQNASSKNVEEIKLQENRIKYLEHMLAAFNTNTQESTNPNSHKNEDYPFNESFNKKSMPQYEDTLNKNTLGGKTNNENWKNSSSGSIKDNNDNFTILNARPTSADSTFHGGYKYPNESSDKDGPNRSLYATMRTYASNSDDKSNSGPKLNSDMLSGQRLKLEKDRSANLSDLKSRLDEFTKYAKRSAEQNRFTLHGSTTASRKNEKSIPNMLNSSTDSYSDTNYKSRVRVTNPNSDARPPIDPFYKHRRGVQTDIKQSQDRYSSTKTPEFDNDDENLKERVQKILEKHKFPATGYISDNNRKSSDYNFKSNNDFNRIGSSEMTNIRSYDRNSTDFRYNCQPRDVLGSNDSNIPRLDLSLYNPSSDDLIAKYLDYQGSTNVS